MQNFARKHKYPIDTIDFDFIMVDTEWEDISARPTDGVYIRGLFLEGARWDSKAKALAESRPKQLYTAMPVIHLSPAQHRKEPTSGIYRCPVYKVLSRRGAWLLCESRWRRTIPHKLSLVVS
jgi:dynein heavy chain, axonemal